MCACLLYGSTVLGDGDTPGNGASLEDEGCYEGEPTGLGAAPLPYVWPCHTQVATTTEHHLPCAPGSQKLICTYQICSSRRDIY